MPILHPDRRWLRAMVGLRAGADFNPIIQRTIIPHRGWATVFRITRSTELGFDLVQIDLLAHSDGTRYRVNTGRTAENRPFKPLIDDASVFDVEVGEESAEAYRKNDENRECDSDHRITRENSLAGFCAVFPFRDL